MKSSFIPDYIKKKLDASLKHKEGVIYSKAPGRINLIGEHTDYNNGLVLPAAIDKYCFFAFSPNGQNAIEAYALDKDERITLAIDDLTKTKYEWANFIVGILLEFKKRGVETAGFDCAFTSEVPIGAGMSSSSALECSFLVGLNTLSQATFDNWELIKISQSSNHNFLGIQGGIMDQFASLFGKEGQLMKLDCATKEFDYIPVPSNSYTWLLINTCVQHNHLDSDYNKRVEECNQALSDIQNTFPQVNHISEIHEVRQLDKVSFSSSITAKRAEYIVEENARVSSFVTALYQNDFKLCGTLLYESHMGLSSKYEVSCEELDFLVEALKDDPMVLGSRMMGGGFGGCTINLVHLSKVKALKQEVIVQYSQAFGIVPKFYEVKISDGASVF